MDELQPSTHVVAKGETLSQIASRHGVSARSLQDVNNIRSPRSLQIGQRLVIPGRARSAPNAAVDSSGRTVYTVRSGDSLSRIAKRHGVSVDDLQRWNALGKSTRIHVGDRLNVAASSGRTVRASSAAASA